MNALEIIFIERSPDRTNPVIGTLKITDNEQNNLTRFEIMLREHFGIEDKESLNLSATLPEIIEEVLRRTTATELTIKYKETYGDATREITIYQNWTY